MAAMHRKVSLSVYRLSTTTLSSTWLAVLVFMTSVMLLGGIANAARLKVTVDDIHVGPGSIRVALYANDDSFRHEERASRVISTAANSEFISVTFNDLPAGQYAVVAYHDANDNKKLDLKLGMFPEEGWGLSNDPTVIGPPRFGPSAFDVANSNTNIVVHLHY